MDQVLWNVHHGIIHPVPGQFDLTSGTTLQAGSAVTLDLRIRTLKDFVTEVKCVSKVLGQLSDSLWL